MRNHDELDRLMDAALRTYAEPGADSGLERRVLDRIAAGRKSEPAESRPYWLRSRRVLALSFSAAACLVLLAIVAPRLFHRPVQHTEESRQIAAPAQSTGRTAPVITARATDLRIQKTVRHMSKVSPALHPALQVSLPKLDQFPAPQPLTTEEKALIALAEQQPDHADNLLTDQLAQPPEPLTVAAIKIAPIEMPSPGKN